MGRFNSVLATTMKNRSYDIIGKSYIRGLVFSLVFVVIITLIVAVGKCILRPLDGAEVTWELLLYNIARQKWFAIISFVACAVLVSAKVLGRRISES